MDDDDALGPDDPGVSRRYGAPRQRPFLARRLMALAVGVLIIILLVLGVRGCLNARKERGFENYVRDLAAITTESQQLSQEFFDRLQDPGKLTPLSFGAEIDADRGTAENLLQRAQGLDTPDELAEAQSELELAFELRRDGIDGIADQAGTALSEQGAPDAVKQIATYMRYFLASDVLYHRSREAIEGELAAQDIVPDEELSKENFLPDPPEQWLDATQLTTVLAGVSGGGGEACKGVCGLALLETQINGTTLTPDALTTVSGGAPYELEVQAQNQGDQDAAGVPVTFSLTGGAETIEVDGTISEIKPGNTEPGNLNVQPDPEPSAELELEVTVGPVPGEELTDNNTATYTVVFE